MRKALQVLLLLFAIGSLIATGIAFYRIVLTSSIHGTPVHIVDATAGAYHIGFLRWFVSRYTILEEEETEPFKAFCVQWLCNALLHLP